MLSDDNNNNNKGDDDENDTAKTNVNVQNEPDKPYKCFYVDELGFYRHLDPDQLHSVSSNLGPTNRQCEAEAYAKLRANSSNIDQKKQNFDSSDTTNDESKQIQQQEEIYYKEIRNSLGISHFDGVVNYKQWKNNWDEFMKVKLTRKEPITLNHDFKMRIRSGIPHDYRSKVWSSMIRMRTREIRSKYGENLYEQIIRFIEKEQKTLMSTKLNVCFKQIDLDVLRTLPNNRHFENVASRGTKRVRRILRAYAYFNPTIGYCQGMNRLAATALLVLPENEAFWCLVAIIQGIMPKDYYLKPWLAQVDCSVLSELMEEKMPNLHRHLYQKETQLTVFTWFFTIFVDAFRPELMLRIWDCFLLEGDIILFRFALAISTLR